MPANFRTSFPSQIFNAALFLFFISGINSHASEVIQNYQSRIQIEQDGSLNVTEVITVSAEGNKIKRGIYRDFPTRYKDPYGNHYRVNFQLLSVMRNGQSEDYHTESIHNGMRIYIGNKERILSHGTHIFTLEFYITRQLGFFDNYDELYWNVTGNEWAFPILQASAKIQLPHGVKVNQVETDAYTGAVNEKGKQFVVSMLNDNTVFFDTSKELPLHHGLSIVVNWPKGYVIEPDKEQKISWFFQDNRAVIVGLSGLGILFIYFFIMWLKVGKDPQKGVIYPQYKPDKNHSPASMRFVKKMAYDKKTFAAALVNMAVKGFLNITDSGSHFSLKKIDEKVKLSLGERAIAHKMFAWQNEITLKQSEHETITKALTAHEKVLRRDYEKIYFRTNRWWLSPGWLISLITVVLTIMAIDNPGAKEVIAFFTLWLSIWSIGVTVLALSIYHSWKKIHGFLSLFPALFITAFAIPFFAGEIFGLYMMWQNAGTGVLLIFVFIIVSNVLFYNLMKAPTLKGRTLLDKIDGFKLYLEVAESSELKMQHTPTPNPELFEKFLPYAIALGVETQWAKRFQSIFSKLEQQGKHKSPSWYRGNQWQTDNLTGFSSSVGSSLSSAVSSSSTAPGSSSGSGGGGFSGGGGGGGGGGGW